MKRKVFFHKVLSLYGAFAQPRVATGLGQAVGYPGDVAGEC
jgi:hypothetical protein